LMPSLAAMRGKASSAFVGPVVKIDAETLPRRANLHGLGQQLHALLLQLVAG